MKRIYWWIKFYLATGNKPVQDDLDRAMCPEAGKIMHMDCGWNCKHNKPNFMVPTSLR